MFSIRIQLSRALLGACLALLVPPDAAFAAAAETREPVVTPEPPPIPDTLRTPRATMQAFLAAMTAVRAGEQAALADAAATLDLDEINPLVRPEKGAELAWLLAEALEFTGTPEPQRIPRRTTGKPFVFQEYDEGRIAIAFEEDVGWRFAADTVAALPAIVDGLIARREAAGERVDRGWRDTTVMASDDRVSIAFVAEQPGKWMFHCHMIEHQSAGMMAFVDVEGERA